MARTLSPTFTVGRRPEPARRLLAAISVSFERPFAPKTG